MEESFIPSDFQEFPLSMHKTMLGDSVRMSAFASAIKKSVKPGDVVIDIGTGTGVMAFLAHQAGAEEVVGIDCNDSVLRYARKVKESEFPNANISFYQGDARRVVENLANVKADVVICELLGTCGKDENIVEIAKNIRERYLKPDGILIPMNLALWIAPIRSDEIYQKLRFWSQRIHGISFAQFQDLAFQNIYTLQKEKKSVVCAPQCLQEICLYDSLANSEENTVSFKFLESATVHGFLGWFQSELSENNQIDTGPFSNDTHWSQFFFPCGEELNLNQGDVLDVTFRESIDRGDRIWRWRGTLFDKGVKLFDLSAQRPNW